MNTRYLMIASSLVMAAIGIPVTFAPQEILHRVQSDATAWEMMVAQLGGALYCGFALMNWMAKGMLLGGIYGRPIVIGNLVHSTMGALALLKMEATPSTNLVKWLLLGIYVVFAAGFGYAMMNHPARAAPAK